MKFPISNFQFPIIVFLMFVFFIFPTKIQAIVVTEKQATVYCQNDPSVSLEIPTDTFKKPTDITLQKLSEEISEVRPPQVNKNDFTDKKFSEVAPPKVNRFSGVYKLSAADEATGEPRNYFQKEMKLKIPADTESLDNLAIFFWDRKAQTWIATDGEILDQGRDIITGKVNYTGFYTIMKKRYDGNEPDYFKHMALGFVGAGLIIILALWYNKKRKTKRTDN